MNKNRLRFIPKPASIKAGREEDSPTPRVIGADLRVLGITDPEHQFLPRKEAAKFLGQRPQTLAVWACDDRHKLPYRKVGRHVIYRVSDLMRFLENGNQAD